MSWPRVSEALPLNRCNRLALEALGEENGREMMDKTLEQMFPKWVAKVRAEACEEGFRKGFRIGFIKFYLDAVRNRLGAVPSGMEEQLWAASLEELDGWRPFRLEASNVDEAMKGNGSWGNGVPV